MIRLNLLLISISNVIEMKDHIKIKQHAILSMEYHLIKSLDHLLPMDKMVIIIFGTKNLKVDLGLQKKVHGQ